MRYLKTFESINNPYREISEVELISHLYGDGEVGEEEFIQDNWRMFSDKEINEIKSIFTNFKEVGNFTIRVSVYESESKSPLHDTDIFKLRDEWFYIEFNSKAYSSIDNDSGWKFYQCDQFDGLLECLKYLKKKYEKR